MKKLVLTLSLLAFSNAALAEAAGYLGLGIGRSSADDFDAVDLAGVDLNTDETDTAYKIFAGIRFSPYFAMEAGYHDFGEASHEYTAGGFFANANFEAEAVQVAWLIGAPVGPVNAYARLGFAFWRLEATTTSNVPGIPDASIKADSVSPVYGLGGEFPIGAFAIRADWERTMDVGDKNTTGESDVDVLGVSALFRF